MIKITFKQLLNYTFGAFCVAIVLQMFYSPNGIVAGGVSGLGVIIESLSIKYTGVKVPLWLTTAAINIPLLIGSYKIRGKDILIRSAIVVGLLTGFLWILDFFTFKQMDITISTVMGAVIMGVGLGAIFKNGGTSGGTDLLAAVITKLLPRFTISKVLFVIDCSIIILGFLVFGIEKGLYGVVAVYCCTKTIDYMLVGGNASKAAFIITDKSEEMSQMILKNVNRGVTAFYGRGMYSKNDKTVLYCVVSNNQITKLKAVIREVDTEAFISIGDVHEVVGAGFKTHDDNSL